MNSAKDNTPYPIIRQLHGLPPTTPKGMEVDEDYFIHENYNNPNWWPTAKLFSTYSMYLKFCHDLTSYRQSKGIEIVNEPVDFLNK